MPPRVLPAFAVALALSPASVSPAALSPAPLHAVRVVVVGGYAPVLLDGAPAGLSPTTLHLGPGPHRVGLAETPWTAAQHATVADPPPPELVFTTAWKPSWLTAPHPVSVDGQRRARPVRVERFGVMHVVVHPPGTKPRRHRIERCLQPDRCLLPGATLALP